MIHADEVTYNHEYAQRIRVGHIGCGGHSFRNVLPAFQYAPVDLVAVCDLDIVKARAFARQFGAERAYADYSEMLKKEQLDAVFIVTNYDDSGEPRAAAIAKDVLRSGRHVWMEKPQPGDPQLVRELMQISQAVNKWVFVGYKKMFFPSIVKAKELMSRSDFGALTSCYAR